MDPNACLRRWRQAIKDGDRDEARDAREDLKTWIRGGGFLPHDLTKKERQELGLTTAHRGARLRATRIRINRQGYDPSGRYWGVGAPLYRVYSTDGELDEHVRAQTAKDARDKFKGRANPLRCRGKGPQNARRLTCVGKRNPALENPRRHFPKTARGRPPVSHKWTADIFHDAHAPRIGRKILTGGKDAVYSAAKKMVGKKYRGKVVHKVILDGPK